MEEPEAIGNTGDVLLSEDGKNVDEQLKSLFETVIKKVRLSVSNGKLTPDSFQTILLKVVETVEELGTSPKLSGTEKRAIAINITRLVIDDLHQNGQMDDETYGWMSLGLTFLAPALFSGIKALFSKLQDVAEDISEKGMKGCFTRNCLRKKA